MRLSRVLLQEHITKTKFKHAMQRVANQAMILTTCATSSPVTESDYRGVTLSSVTSLALHPTPMMQFNLQVPSFTSEALHRTGYFAIHLMKPNTTSVELTKLFSKGSVVQPYIEKNMKMIKKDITETGGLKKFFSNVEKRFDTAPTNPASVIKHKILPFKPFEILKATDYTAHAISITKIPLLNNCDRVFICKAAKQFHVGDHEIWVGEVQDIFSGEELRNEEAAKGDLGGGMVYCNREFKGIGTTID